MNRPGVSTVKPYDLSDKEIELVSKTGAGSIEYFKLNGKIDKGNDLVFSVETRKKGKLVGDKVRSSGDYERNYKDTLISFGTSNIGGEDDVLNLMIGVPSGVARIEQPNKMMASTMCRMIDSKMILTKEKPTYLAIWKGTDENSMSCSTGEDGGLPQGLEEADVDICTKFCGLMRKGEGEASCFQCVVAITLKGAILE